MIDDIFKLRVQQLRILVLVEILVSDSMKKPKLQKLIELIEGIPKKDRYE